MKVLNYNCVWSKAIYGKCTYDWNTEYLEPEDHDEEAAGDGEDHVEEEVAVVAVADAVVEPGAVVVHLEHATVAHRAVVRARGLRVDALLAHRHNLKGNRQAGVKHMRNQQHRAKFTRKKIEQTFTQKR